MSTILSLVAYLKAWLCIWPVMIATRCTDVWQGDTRGKQRSKSSCGSGDGAGPLHRAIARLRYLSDPSSRHSHRLFLESSCRRSAWLHRGMVPRCGSSVLPRVGCARVVRGAGAHEQLRSLRRLAGRTLRRGSSGRSGSRLARIEFFLRFSRARRGEQRSSRRTGRLFAVLHGVSGTAACDGELHLLVLINTIVGFTSERWHHGGAHR